MIVSNRIGVNWLVLVDRSFGVVDQRWIRDSYIRRNQTGRLPFDSIERWFHHGVDQVGIAEHMHTTPVNVSLNNLTLCPRLMLRWEFYSKQLKQSESEPREGGSAFAVFSHYNEKFTLLNTNQRDLLNNVNRIFRSVVMSIRHFYRMHTEFLKSQSGVSFSSPASIALPKSLKSELSIASFENPFRSPDRFLSDSDFASTAKAFLLDRVGLTAVSNTRLYSQLIGAMDAKFPRRLGTKHLVSQSSFRTSRNEPWKHLTDQINRRMRHSTATVQEDSTTEYHLQRKRTKFVLRNVLPVHESVGSSESNVQYDRSITPKTGATERVFRSQPPVQQQSPASSELTSQQANLKAPKIDMAKIDKELWRRFEKRMRIEHERRGRG